MKTKNTFAPFAIAASLAAGALSTDATASPESDLAHHAHRILDIADDLASEYRTHYRHTSSYRHLTSDISKIRSKARHIDSLSHDCRSSLSHINADLKELDRLAHHLHDVVDHISHGRHGHTHGNTRHVHSLQSSLNNSIHSMERVVESLRHSHRGHSDHYRHHSRVDHSPARIIGGLLWALSN
jgi:hypothetical protein